LVKLVLRALACNHLSGGAGDDTICSDDTGSVDTDSCGSGTTSAEVDANDTLSSDCENVTVA
jgi:hypothetical protein